MAITFTSNLDVKNNRITNVGAPAVSSDAVTKQYVDNVATGLVWKMAVRVGATSNVSLTSPGTIDGVTLANGNRVLLMGQTNAAQNGIYVFSGGALTRAADADQDAEMPSGTAVTVTEGTANGNKTYNLITDDPITVGTTALTWSLLNAGTSPLYSAGNGIDVTNNVITAKAATSGGTSVTASGIGVVADPAGGVQVGANGVATKLAANKGLAVDTSGLAFVTKTAGGLTTDASGASIVVKANSGIAVDATGVSVVLATNKGLTEDANGVAVVPGNGIALDSAGVRVVADPAGGLQTSSAGVATKLASPSGLSATSGGLAVVPKSAGGLAVDASGVSVVPKPNTGITVDGTGVGVFLRPNDGLDVDGTGIGITTDAAGGLATTSAGLKAVAGVGIVVGTDIKIDTTLVPRKFSASVGDGSATSYAIVHSLNTRDVHVELYNSSAPYDTVYAEVQRTDANTVTVLFGTAPTSGQYRCVVVG
jgi:hypothetical protein